MGKKSEVIEREEVVIRFSGDSGDRIVAIIKNFH